MFKDFCYIWTCASTNSVDENDGYPLVLVVVDGC